MSMKEAANRLHHLSMRYGGALIELVSGKPVGLIINNHPGLREARDLIDLILLTRAEISGLTKILYEAKLITTEKLNKIMEEEYDWLAKVKANFLNVGLTDHGIVFYSKPSN